MKKLSQVVSEAKVELDISEDSINFIDASEIKKYMKVADKFLSIDAKKVCVWLIDNNSTYVKELGKGEGNALANFYMSGMPKDPEMKDLWVSINKVVKSGRSLEIPVFQTEEQFDAIISGKEAPDAILLDLTSEKGRNEIAKKYTPLVWKIARSFNGKSTFSLDELYSIGNEGLVRAMNAYGKSKAETQKKRHKSEDGELDELDELIDLEETNARKQFTFMSYAAYCIRISILEAIKDESHLVRVPRSQQKKEREETGRNTKSHAVSGDEGIGHDSEGNSKSLFDIMGDEESEDGGRSLDKEDIAKLWKAITKKLEETFSEKTLDIFYSFYGLFGHEKLKAKEIMAKYKMKNPSEVTNSNFKVFHLIKTDKNLNRAFTELYTLYKECLHDEETADRDFEPIHLGNGVSSLVEKNIDRIVV